MTNMEIQEQPTGIFDNNPRWLIVCLLVMFLLAALIRRDEIQAPGFAPTREYTSAIIARALYFAGNDNIATWRQDIAINNKNQQPILEPPLTEYLISLIYRIIGNEEVWYVRYLTSSFWLIGGIFLYKITKILLTVDGAIIATAYYLFVPISIIVSRSFQPEALMMMMLLISLYYIILYFKTPTYKHLLLSAILTGVTIFIRPLVIFVLLCVFIAISIHKKGKLSRVLDWPFIVFVGISLIIPFVYYGYGILIADFMRWKVAHSFRPHLFTHWQYWNDWFNMGVNSVGHSAFIVALLGFFFIQKSFTRIFVVGLAIGYLIFGLVFNFHIMTHFYYQVQSLPIIGICIAPLLVNIVTTLKKKVAKYYWVPIAFGLFFGLYFSYREVQDTLYRPVFEPPEIAWEIGEIVNHSPRVVTLAYEYGLPLSYYGEFSGTWWPERAEYELYRAPGDRELSVQERLDLLGFRPDYFVITNFDRYDRSHQDLKGYLETNCEILAQTDMYLIYNSCQSLETTEKLPTIPLVSHIKGS